MQVYPLNEKEVQSWHASLSATSLFSRHLRLVVVANVFYLTALVSLSLKLAASTAMNVVLVGDGVAVAVAGLAGYYLFHLYRMTRALLAEQNLPGAQQESILRISYIAFRLYFVLLMALGALMIGLAEFARI